MSQPIRIKGMQAQRIWRYIDELMSHETPLPRKMHALSVLRAFIDALLCGRVPSEFINDVRKAYEYVTWLGYGFAEPPPESRSREELRKWLSSALHCEDSKDPKLCLEAAAHLCTRILLSQSIVYEQVIE